MRKTTQTGAILGLVVATSAFAVVPALHLIGHEDDHVHVGGAIVPTGGHSDSHHGHHHHAEHHSHLNGSHEHGGPVEPGESSGQDASDTPVDSEPDAPPASPWQHGLGSLAHFAAASLTPVAPTVVPSATTTSAAPGFFLSAAPALSNRRSHRARAPPAIV